MLSGQNLASLLKEQDNSNEYFVVIECEFKGLEQEMEHNPPWKSGVIPMNLFHPSWAENLKSFTYETRNLDYAHLIIRAIEVKEGTVLGRQAIHMSALKSGYRAAQMMNDKHYSIPFTNLLFNVGYEEVKVTGKTCSIMKSQMNSLARNQFSKSKMHPELVAAKLINGTYSYEKDQVKSD